MKATYTIIDAWLMRISCVKPTLKAEEDFALPLSSSHNVQERFVEWKLITEAVVEDVNWRTSYFHRFYLL
ncbi:hypothetical protein F4821DRAFT_252252 [Hypoxylon rubiginosum]|uniref:Uncharacterized protein n=1 Tax=Hypoxylon rubiginosum TaxID=110542 RepID=A0ACC0CID9_9PEZI|nr:hypothetical protein F4821DRAFT_252252 [Hypoxylon rubiginosum]